MRRGSSINNAIWCVNALLALGIIGFSFKYIFLAKSTEGATNLPPGLALSPGGTISGTPAAAGTWYFAVQVADSDTHTATQTLCITVTSSAVSPEGDSGGREGTRPSPTDGSLAIATTSLPNGQVGRTYSSALQASGGKTPYTWSGDPWPSNPIAPAQETGHVGKGLDEFKAVWESQLVPPAQAPPKAAETWPQIKYDGKFGSQLLFKVNGQDGQGKPGAAVEVSDGQGGWQPVTVNGKRVLVKEIQTDKCILELEGSPSETKEIQLLDQEGGGGPPPNPGGGGPGGGPGKTPNISFGTREVAEKTWKVDPKERDFLRGNAQELAKDVRWSLYGVENGKAKGVRIEGFTEGSYAEQFAKARGIAAGDIIMTINGRTIDGAATVNELFGDGEAWQTGKAQVEVERAGKVQTLSYAVQ